VAVSMERGLDNGRFGCEGRGVCRPRSCALAHRTLYGTKRERASIGNTRARHEQNRRQSHRQVDQSGAWRKISAVWSGAAHRGGGRGGYDELLTGISSTVKPADILEDIWVRDIVDLVWEGFRLRRLKVNLMTATAHKGLKEALTPLVGWSEADDLAKAWALRKPIALKRVDKILASAGMTMDAVMAQTLSLKLDDVERIERMIAMAEARRHVILHEIEWHREMLSQALRRAVQQVEDGQLRVIENTSVSRRHGE
jgi:hypothetical protein